MKVRTQVMLDDQVYTHLIALKEKFRAKNLSFLVNQILQEAFEYKKRLDNKESAIMNLQDLLTEANERAMKYRKRIVELEKYGDSYSSSHQ